MRGRFRFGVPIVSPMFQLVGTLGLRGDPGSAESRAAVAGRTSRPTRVRSPVDCAAWAQDWGSDSRLGNQRRRLNRIFQLRPVRDTCRVCGNPDCVPCSAEWQHRSPCVSDASGAHRRWMGRGMAPGGAHTAAVLCDPRGDLESGPTWTPRRRGGNRPGCSLVRAVPAGTTRAAERAPSSGRRPSEWAGLALCAAN